MNKAVGIWVRVSTDMQGDSPEHHLKRAEYYAQLKEWEVRTVYRLEAVSGKSITALPEFKQMLADIKRGYITGLIFSKLARVARNTKELLELADYFKDHKADLISLEEQLDTSTPMGRFFYTLIAAIAQWEREEIASRVAASVSVRARLGKNTGGQSPYGYKWENKKLVLDEKEAPIRRLMFELFAKTKRKKATAKALNDKGFTTRNGSKFTDTTVDRLLRDPMAKGIRRANYTKSRGQKKHWDYKPSKDWVLTECPAIVSEELWTECNAFLDQQRKKLKRMGRLTKFLLAGFVECHCGEKMYVFHKSPSYTCKTCKTKILVSDIDEIYHSQLKGFLLADGNEGSFKEQTETMLEEKTDLLESTAAEAKSLEQQMNELVQMRVKRELTPEDFTRHYQPLKIRFEQLENPLAELQAEIDALRIQALSTEVVIQNAKDLYARWSDMAFEDKRTVVEAITKQVIIGTHDVTVKLARTPSSPNPTSLQNDGKRQHMHRDSSTQSA